MEIQLIFVVETNQKCKSDWIYIKETIDRFYSYDKNHVKLSPIYMNGKGNYNSRKVLGEIQRLRKQYQLKDQSRKVEILYCFDCDHYDTQEYDKKFLEDAMRFCQENGYRFVWFCRDIESVFLRRPVPDGEKKID